MCTTTPDQSGPRSSNERILHTSQISKTGASPSDSVLCHTQSTPFLKGVLPLSRGYSQPILSPPERVEIFH